MINFSKKFGLIFLVIIFLYGGFSLISTNIDTPVSAAGPTVLWLEQFGTNGRDYPNGISVVSSGVYVVGNTDGTFPGQTSSGDLDGFIRKYTTDGNEVWTRQFGTSGSDSAKCICINISGIYIGGTTNSTFPNQNNTGGVDVFVRKYDINGNEVWTRQFGSSGSDICEGISVDSSGIYVVGDTTSGTLPGQSSAGYGDAFIRKYTTDGNEVWTRQFGTSSFDGCSAISVISSGVYVAGWSGGTLPGQTSSGDVDGFIRKYTTNGNEVWTSQFGTSESDTCYGISVDSSGVYVGGETSPLTERPPIDVFIRKYTTDGNEVWIRHIGPSRSLGFFAISAYSSGIYVVGNIVGTLPGQTSSGDFDGFIRKYAADGNEVWTSQFGTSDSDSNYGVSVDSSGVYVAGDTYGTFPGQTYSGLIDSFVAKIIEESVPPAVATQPATNIGSQTATLNGNLTSLGTASLVTVSFEYGTTTAYGNTTPAQPRTTIGAFSANITGLTPGTTYHFRPKADGGANGVAYGSDRTFACAPILDRIYGIPIDFRFNIDLSKGQNNPVDDVWCLQIILNSDPDTIVAESGDGSPGNETTYFGDSTENAVIRFQEKYAGEILTPAGLTQGNGFVGEFTRAKLNGIISDKFTQAYKTQFGLLAIEERKSTIWQDIKTFKSDYLPENFPDELVLAIASTESGQYAHWNNEHVANDWGRGIMQITTNGYVGAGGVNSDSAECIAARNRDSKGASSRYYTNSLLGIEANIKDGLAALGEKRNYASTFKNFATRFIPYHGSFIPITENDFKNIVAIWGYNGIVYEYNYLADVADKLSSLKSFFVVPMSDDDVNKWVTKLQWANNNRKEIRLMMHSSAELRAYDSTGHVTGLVNGKIKEEAVNSSYDVDNEMITILFPDETYAFQAVGSSYGAYGLEINYESIEKESSFIAEDIPTSPSIIHQYSIDWDALSQGRPGVLVEIDNNGDGKIERAITSDSELTADEFEHAPSLAILSAGAVSPASGTKTTKFKYSVTYKNPDNETPSWVRVNIDNSTSVDMTLKSGQDGNFINGEIYEYTSPALAIGSHNYKFSASDGTNNAVGDTSVHTGPKVSAASSGGGGGGGGGSSSSLTTVSLNGLVSAAPIQVNGQGIIQSAAQLKNLDGNVLLDVTKGTKLLTTNSNILSSLTAGIMDSPPAPMAGQSIIAAYTFGPDGAKFDPALTLTMSYDPTKLPENISEEGLYIAYYDGTQWQSSNSTVDTKSKMVSAKISHFSSFALMGKVILPSPAPVTDTVAANTIPTQPSPTTYPPVEAIPSPSPSTQPVAVQPALTETPSPAGVTVLSVQTDTNTSPAVSPAQSKPKESKVLVWLLSLMGLVIIAILAVVVFTKSRDKSRKL
jgi:hypothetical protein